MKTVKTRDSATTILRKLGVNSRDYNLYIQKTDAGIFIVDEAMARKAVVGEVVIDLVKSKDVELKPAPTKEPVISRTAVVQKMIDSTKPKEKRPTISSMSEELLIAGKTNAEVWAAIKGKFNLGDDKKHYPSWFRSRLRRKGKLAKKEKKS